MTTLYALLTLWLVFVFIFSSNNIINMVILKLPSCLFAVIFGILTAKGFNII